MNLCLSDPDVKSRCAQTEEKTKAGRTFTNVAHEPPDEVAAVMAESRLGQSHFAERVTGGARVILSGPGRGRLMRLHPSGAGALSTVLLPPVAGARSTVLLPPGAGARSGAFCCCCLLYLPSAGAFSRLALLYSNAFCHLSESASSKTRNKQNRARVRIFGCSVNRWTVTQ